MVIYLCTLSCSFHWCKSRVLQTVSFRDIDFLVKPLLFTTLELKKSGQLIFGFNILHLFNGKSFQIFIVYGQETYYLYKFKKISTPIKYLQSQMCTSFVPTKVRTPPKILFFQNQHYYLIQITFDIGKLCGTSC